MHGNQKTPFFFLHLFYFGSGFDHIGGGLDAFGCEIFIEENITERKFFSTIIIVLSAKVKVN